uniref:Uncharacterized protein n=1 Tax=viral metagenome TaxID=1070528 RepID=A0A6C0HRP2_9ZZZZ
MDSNLVLSFLFGLFAKVYDDIIDNKLNISEYYVDILKYFVISLVSIVCFNDAVFSIIYFEMTLLSLLMDKFYTSNLDISKDTDDEKDLLALNDNVWVYSCILSGICIIYHIFKNFAKININFSFKNLTFFINILINFFIITLDIYFTPEHSSDKKLYARIFVLVILCIFIYYMSRFQEYIYEGNYGIILMNIGFLIGSVTFLTLDKFKVFDNFKNKNVNDKYLVNHTIDDKEDLNEDKG